MLFQNGEVATTAQILVSRKQSLELRNCIMRKGTLRYACAEASEHVWGITRLFMQKTVATLLLG